MNAEQAYLFAHGLARDAAYQLQMPADRAWLHGQALSILEQGSDLDGAVAIELAQHALAAQKGGESDAVADLQRRELQYAVAAARYSMRAHDLSQAVALHKRVCAHPFATGRQRGIASRDCARALLHQGKPDEALRWIEGREAPAELDLRLELDESRTAALMQLGRLAQARECAEHALKMLAASGGELECQLLSTLGAVLSDLGDIEAAMTALDRAESLAEDLSSPALRAQIGNNRARALLSRGNWAQAAVLFHGVQQLAQESESLRVYCNATVGRGACLLNLGRTDEADAELKTALRIARQIGNFREEAVALTNLGNVQEWRGQVESAAEYHSRSLEMHRETGNRRAAAVAMRNLANLVANAERFEEAEELVKQALRLSRDVGDAASEGPSYAVLATIHYHQGRISACLRACERANVALAHAGNVFLRAAANTYRALIFSVLMRHDEAMEATEATLAELLPPTPTRLLVDFGLAIRAQVLIGAAIDVVLVQGQRDEALLRRASEAIRDLGSRAQHASSPEKCGTYVSAATGWIEQLRRGLWPMCWAGSRIGELSPRLRAAALDNLRSNRPELLALIQAAAPDVIVAMLDCTAGAEIPNWRNDDVP